MRTLEHAPSHGAAHDVAFREYEPDRSFRDEALAEFDVLYRIAVQLTTDRPSAKRLLQQAILAAYRSWQDRPDELDPPVWIARVLVREHRRLFQVDEKAQERRATSWAPAVTFLNEALMDDNAWAAAMKKLAPTVVRRTIEQLPLSARRMLALSEIAGFSYTELASVLDCAVHQAKNRLYAARGLLKWRLAIDMKQA